MQDHVPGYDKWVYVAVGRNSYIGSAWECSVVLGASHLHLPLDTCILYVADFFFLYLRMSYKPIRRLCKAFDVNTVTLIK